MEITEIEIETLKKIIEKYQLGPKGLFEDPEVREMLDKAKNEDEAIKIVRNLPLIKLNEIVRKVEKGELPLEKMNEEIKKELNVNDFISSKIAKELEEALFKKKRVETISSEKITPKKEKDIYREPIE